MYPLACAINLAFAAVLTLAPLWFSRRYLRLPTLNPYSIALAVSVPVQAMKLVFGPLALIEGGLLDENFQFAVLMGNLLAASQTAGMVFFFKLFKSWRAERHLPFNRTALSPRDLRRAARALLVVFLSSFYLLASGDFGLINWLSNPREGYQFYRTGQGHWYAIATSSLAASYVLYCISRPAAGAILRRTIVFLGLAYLLGSKYVLLSFFVAAITLLWFIRWRHLRLLILAGAPIVFALAIWNLYLATGDTFELATVIEYFDYYKNAADYYRDYHAGEIPLFLGELSLSSLWGYVPRTIWPDKPVVYGILLIDEIFYPGAAEATSTPAFGGGVEQFADFGIPGLLIFGFFSSQAWASALVGYLLFVRPGVRFDRITLLAVAALIVQFAPGFGLYFPGLLYVGLLMWTLGVIALVRRRRRGWPSADLPGRAHPEVPTPLQT